MALFESSNPTLSQKIFDKNRTMDAANQGVMSVRGTINKFGFLMLMVIGGAVYTWNMALQNPEQASTWMWGGLIGGFIVALITTFKPTWAPYTAPAYAILEGLLLGALSAFINEQFKDKYPGLVTQAVGLTFGVAIAMFLLYNFRVIKPTQKLRSIVFVATAGIAIFYLISMVLSYGFHINVPLTSWEDTSWISIGFSLFVIAIAALNLIMDFGRIEEGAEAGAPKYMEWYGAFGLLVTIVWLYIEILRLLSRFAKRN